MQRLKRVWRKRTNLMISSSLPLPPSPLPPLYTSQSQVCPVRFFVYIHKLRYVILAHGLPVVGLNPSSQSAFTLSAIQSDSTYFIALPPADHSTPLLLMLPPVVTCSAPRRVDSGGDRRLAAGQQQRRHERLRRFRGPSRPPHRGPPTNPTALGPFSPCTLSLHSDSCG